MATACVTVSLRAAIAAGAVQFGIPVTLAGDDVEEATETFRLAASSVVGATVGAPTAMVTVKDDDGPPGACTGATITWDGGAATTGVEHRHEHG